MSQNKLEVMLELERRGALPPEKSAILEELRKRGVVPGGDNSDFSVGEMVSNIPSSAKQFAGDIVQPFIHPVDTAKAIGSLFTDESARSNMADFLRDRYGSLDNVKNTVEKDPVGFLADVSTILTAGGGLAARAPGVAGKVGSVVSKAGMASDPLNVVKTAGRASGRALGQLVPSSVPQKMYESAAKFSTTLPQAKRTEMTKTALEYGIMPSAKGVDKLGGLLGDFDTKITGLIDEATASGKTIPRSAVYRHLREVRQNLGGVKIEGGQDLRQVSRVAKMFDQHMKKLGKDTLTPTELQAFKQDAYQRINFDAKNLKSNKGTDEARKAMARAAKESIEQVAPVKDLNREFGRLLEIKDPIERAASRIENRNIVGISAPLNIGAGATAGGQAGAAAGTLLSILEQPKAKARLAIALRNLKAAGLEGLLDQSAVATLTQQGLFQAGRAKDEIK